VQQQITGTRFYSKKEHQKREKKNTERERQTEREREREDIRLGNLGDNNEINTQICEERGNKE